MKPETITIGTPVRVREHYRIADRRGMVGRIVEHYGEDGHTAKEDLAGDIEDLRAAVGLEEKM